jgi:hypothetical protein
MSDTPRGLTPQQEEQLLLYLTGTMDARHRAAFETELFANDALAEAFYAEQTLAEYRFPSRQRDVTATTPVSGGAAGRVPRRPARRRSRWPYALAAGVLILLAAVLTYPRFLERFNGAERLRGSETPDTGDDISVLHGATARFVWRSDARAAVYRFRAYDENGHPIGTTTTRDTFVVAAAVLPDTSRSGVWLVVPQTLDGIDLPGQPPRHFFRHPR